MICGDFIIDWSSNDYTKREFSNLLDKYGLFQLVTKPTRENSIIDYIIVQAVDSNKSRIEDTEEKFPSDHKPLFVSVNILPFTPNNDIRCEKIRDYQLLDQDTFQDQIRQSKMADKSFFSDLNSLQCVNLYNTEMSNIINNLCPEQVRTFRRDQTKRWFTTDLTKLKRKKRQMERRMKKHKNSNRLKEEYSKIKNYYTKSVKQARVNFFSESIKKCEFDSKRLYKVLHSLTGKKTDKVFPDKENEHQTAEKMSDFFVEKVNNIRRNILEGNNSSNIINTKFEQTKSVTTSFNDFQKITLKTLKEIISSVKKKSCKLDPLPTTILMKNIEPLYPFFLHVVNSVISECFFPTPLKHAIVIPLLKNPSLDPNIFKNYRPVSLLPFLSKFLEKSLFVQLDQYIENNNLHASNQSAYRSKHSCETALVSIVDDIQKLTAEGNNVAVILLDSSAAFDTVDHGILLKTLSDDFHIKGNALKLITSYLSERTFALNINQNESSTRSLEHGVPQGSILGPTLYTLYTKAIQEIAQNHNMIAHMYADDCQLYIALNKESQTNTENTIAECLSAIKRWMSESFLKLNAEKTQVKIFKSKSSETVSVPSLELFLSEYVSVTRIRPNRLFPFQRLYCKESPKLSIPSPKFL